MGAFVIEGRGERDVLALRQGDQVGGLDTKRLRDPVQPADRDGAGARLQPAHRLWGGRRFAAVRHILKSHFLRAPDLADAGDHENYLQTGSVRSFLQIYPDGKMIRMTGSTSKRGSRLLAER